MKRCYGFPAVRGALKIKIFQISEEKKAGMLQTGFQLLLSNNRRKDKRFPVWCFKLKKQIPCRQKGISDLAQVKINYWGLKSAPSTLYAETSEIDRSRCFWSFSCLAQMFSPWPLSSAGQQCSVMRVIRSPPCQGTMGSALWICR